MKRIYLVRHCKASGQEPAAKLTTEGKTQSALMSNFFISRSIDLIVSSPFERAVSSIRPLAEKVNLEIQIDERLSERVLSSENRDDWMECLKDSFENLDFKLSGGESSNETMDRGVQVINELLDRKENNFVVVTHGNLLTLILKYFDGRIGYEDWKRLTNPDVYELQFMEGVMEIKRLPIN